MNWLGGKKRTGDQVRTLTISGVLDEQTFWQIVRTEKERADRSGMPVTVAVFTVNDDATHEHSMSGWNGASLCGVLRATARLTDHVGIAGENELGVLLWGTRELGAYRFVKRLGAKAERLAANCRLFVYPTLSGDSADDDSNDVDNILEKIDQSNNSILDRIADVENKLAQALDVETPVVKDEDFIDQDESFGFGFGEPDDAEAAPEPASPTATFTSGGTATLSAPAKQQTTDDLLAKARGAKVVSAVAEAEFAPATSTAPKMDVVMEPLENLFLFPHPFWKRVLDIVGATLGLVFLSPVLLAVAALIKLTSPGPVLFKQLREGHGGKLFTIFKFRTMRVGADAEKAALQAQSEQDGPAFKMTHDPRITPVGSFLRKTCLDELPQLWNVVRGDMTLVGPRPLDYRESQRIARWGRRRMHVMPGLTCIWQVHGKSKVSFNEWMRMDIRYAQKVNFTQDIKLVLETLKQVLLRKASQ